MSAPLELRGKRFGRLLVLERAESRAGRTFWSVACDCGARKHVTGSNLVRGLSTSCGCLTMERVLEATVTHGHKAGGGATPEYTSWAQMKARCRNPQNARYRDYGGRGVKVCQRWLSFENFLADMGPKPSRHHSIDRLDNDGDYEPENCRWATAQEQGRNTRSVKLSEEAATEIRRRLDEGESQYRVAADFGVSRSAIGAIARGRTWGTSRAGTRCVLRRRAPDVSGKQ
jgi:hypothetical protein